MSLEGSATPGQTLKGRVNAVDILTISAYGIAVKNGFNGTEEEWLLSLEANPERIKQYVNEYLTENPVATDATLSTSGMAADAKATGEAIAELQRTTENFATEVVNAHVENKENPHGVTKAQLGLSNVDNTSDKNKPVSTAQAVAIADAKKAGTDAQTLANNAQTAADNAQVAAENAQVNAEKNAKDYADSLHKLLTVTVPASGWSASAPYTQTVAAEGILGTDTPHYSVVYSADTETALAQKEAFAMVDDLDTTDGSAKFTCFEEKPEVDLTIQMEVNR